MAKRKSANRKRKIQGRDWHGWVCKMPLKYGDPKKDWQLCHWAEPEKPLKQINGSKWVRVKFVEID